MKAIIFSFSLLILPCLGRSPQDIKPCQVKGVYKIMQKNVLGNSTINTKLNDSIQIFLVDTLPNIKWWTDSGTKVNPNKYATGGTVFNKQKLVRIVNISNRKIVVEQPDKMLMLGLQAKNKKGQWLDVERINNGICGLSFKKQYNDTIKPSEEWLTFTQVHNGNIKTKYRLKFLNYLTLYKGVLDSLHYYYSNEIDGTVDECQFLPRNKNN